MILDNSNLPNIFNNRQNGISWMVYDVFPDLRLKRWVKFLQRFTQVARSRWVYFRSSDTFVPSISEPPEVSPPSTRWVANE